MNSKPVISVIIPFHGSIIELTNCLFSLDRQIFTSPFEVIVVESGNTETVKIDNLKLNLKIISRLSLIHSGEARNIGAANSQAELLGFTDADCVLSKNWLAEMHSSLTQGNEIVVGPIWNLYPFHPIASVDNLLQFVDFQVTKKTKVDYFPGCNFGITKNLFNKTEGFGKQRNGSDVVFSIEVIDKSTGNIFFNNKMIIKHQGRKNFDAFIRHHKYFGFYRGYLSLKIPEVQNNIRGNFFYAVFYGVKRLIYIITRTAQWNSPGILRIIFYSPILVVGLTSWVIGFWNGNKKLLAEESNFNNP